MRENSWQTSKPSLRPKQSVELVPVGEPGKTSSKMLTVAAKYDRIFREARRDADIRFVTTLPGARFFLVRARGSTIGYAVVTEKGRVGPACVVDARYSAGLAWAVKEATRSMGAETMSIIVPGVNSGALETLFEAGLRTEFFGAWMSAKPIGAFESYCLASGMLL